MTILICSFIFLNYLQQLITINSVSFEFLVARIENDKFQSILILSKNYFITLKN